MNPPRILGSESIPERWSPENRRTHTLESQPRAVAGVLVAYPCQLLFFNAFQYVTSWLRLVGLKNLVFDFLGGTLVADNPLFQALQ
jgi:hypothetical protein